MSGSTGLGGPFIWFVWFVLAAAVAVIIDVIRRPRYHFGRLGRAPWLTVQLAHVAAAVLVAFDVIETDVFYYVVAALFTITFTQQIAYLLRVVFPSPRRHEARSAAMVAARAPAETGETPETPRPARRGGTPAPVETADATPEE